MSEIKVVIPGHGEMTVEEVANRFELKKEAWNKIPKDKLIVVKCPCCGKKHKRVPSQADRRYCSAECVILDGANVPELYKRKIPWWFFGVEKIDYVICRICGGYYRIINSEHLKTHNINGEEYRENYLEAVIFCQSSSIKRSKISKELGLGFEKGWKPSKEWIDSRRALMLTDANPVYRSEVREKLRILGKERYQDDEWIKSQILVDRYLPVFGKSFESKRHSGLKKIYGDIFENKGYKVIFELPLKVNGNWYVVDVYIKDLKLVVECGDCKEDKIINLTTKYNVIHNPYNNKPYLVKRCKKGRRF